MADGRSKSIKESKIGDKVKAINKNGLLVDSEIIEIFHKDSNSSSIFKKYKFN